MYFAGLARWKVRNERRENRSEVVCFLWTNRPVKRLLKEDERGDGCKGSQYTKPPASSGRKGGENGYFAIPASEVSSLL